MVQEKFYEIGYLYRLFKKIENKKEKIMQNANAYKKQIKEHKIDFDDTRMDYIMRITSLKKTTKKIIEIMIECKFNETPSVRKKYDLYFKNQIQVNNYDLLENIDLFTHSLNTAYEITLMQKPINVTSIGILLALIHDFGKNQKIIDAFEADNNTLPPHEKISADFAQKFFDKEIYAGNNEINSNLINIIVKTIDQQHSSITAQKNSFLEMLRFADGSARKKEIRYIKEVNL